LPSAEREELEQLRAANANLQRMLRRLSDEQDALARLRAQLDRLEREDDRLRESNNAATENLKAARAVAVGGRVSPAPFCRG
jgi:DNA repair exonuclease SbcCD ATPase subunit